MKIKLDENLPNRIDVVSKSGEDPRQTTGAGALIKAKSEDRAIPSPRR